MERRPLVLVNGEVAELPSGDSLPGTGGGGAANIGPLFVTGTGVDYTIPDNCPEVVHFTAADPADIVVLPLPQDVAEGKRIVVRIFGSNDVGLRVPTTTSYFQFVAVLGSIYAFVRGFEVDGITPGWVGENEVNTALRFASASALFVQSADGYAPLTIGEDDDPADPGALSDGSIWATSTALKVKIGGVVYDLTAAGSGATVYECEVDFGPTPVSSGQFTITNPAITPTSKVVAMQSGNAATGKDAEENAWDVLVPRAKANAGDFTLWVECLTGKVSGRFKFNYLVGG
jgi:hypothetical protein